MNDSFLNESFFFFFCRHRIKNKTMATKDFIEFTPSTGSNNATINVTASNNSSSARSTTLNISGGGVSKSVSVEQEANVFTNKTFIIALGNNLLTCKCISDNTSTIRTILLQVKSVAAVPQSAKEDLNNASNFYVGIYAIDNDTNIVRSLASMKSIRIDLYNSILTKTNIITGFGCLYYADDRENLIYNLANVMAYPSKTINIASNDYSLNIIFNDNNIEYWDLAGNLYLNTVENGYGKLALITYATQLTDEQKMIFWRSPKTVNSGDGVQIVGFDVVPISETIQKPNYCKQYIIDDIDYTSIYQFAQQVLQYEDSPIPMNLNTTTNNNQFDFDLYRWK